MRLLSLTILSLAYAGLVGCAAESNVPDPYATIEPIVYPTAENHPHGRSVCAQAQANAVRRCARHEVGDIVSVVLNGIDQRQPSQPILNLIKGHR